MATLLKTRKKGFGPRHSGSCTQPYYVTPEEETGLGVWLLHLVLLCKAPEECTRALSPMRLVAGSIQWLMKGWLRLPEST